MRCLFCLLVLLPLATSAQPESVAPGVSIREVMTVPSGPIKLAHDPASGALWLTTFGDELFRIDAPYSGATTQIVATPEVHGTPMVRGMAVGPGGAIYLVGNDEQTNVTVGIVRRGTIAEGVWTWEDVFRTEPYPLSIGPYDHRLSAVTFSPDGQWLFVASGSRTSHGEEQNTSGAFPGLREVPLTSALFRVPASAIGLTLPADSTALAASGVVYADGFRNAFDMAWDTSGELFAIDNAGDRDDGEELNWIREGHHYGFPFRVGFADTPQRFAGYDPANDPLINPASFAFQAGFFYNDPDYPDPPEAVVFTDPLRNVGPDADLYRESSGAVRDASVTGVPVASFTPHRSPLGLVFDASGALPGDYTNDGFVLGWTSASDPLMAPFGDESEDVLHLEIAPDRASMEVTQIARGFQNPVDAVLVGRTLYVIEIGARAGLWALDFTDDTASEPEPLAGLELTVSPNPSRGAIRVTVSGSPEARSAGAGQSAEIVDALGRVVLRGYPDASGVWLVAPEALAAGVYHAVASGGGEVVSRSFTVVR